MRTILLVAAAALIATSTGLLRAQEPPATPSAGQSAAGDFVRVFMDCNTSGCDDDFFRTEITWVNFVRDRTVAHVHVLVTSEETGSGGRRFTMTFDGLGDFANVRDSLTTLTRQGSTGDEVRREVTRVLALGLARYARSTSAGERLQVTARSSSGETARGSSGTTRDPWNLWVFSIGTHMFGNGDDNYNNLNMFGNINARRVSERWKIGLSSGFDYSENRYELSDGTLRNYQRSSNHNVLVVKSLGGHWSAGMTGGVSSSKYENYSLAVRVLPAIEYDLFPYRESTRRQLVFRYGVGLRSFDYDSITIYGKSKETRSVHELLIAGKRGRNGAR